MNPQTKSLDMSSEKEEKSDQSLVNKVSPDTKAIKVDLKRAVFGGSVSFIVILIGGGLVGFASGSEAHQMLELVLPNTRSFSSTLLLALGNILALMLTLLSLSSSMEVEMKWAHYQRVKQIAWGVTVVLIVTVFMSLLMNIPIVEADKADGEWYVYIYYTILVFSSVLGGAFITIALLLFNTVRDMIGVLDPNKDHSLSASSKEEE
jgi:hypothetical protein